MRSEDVFSASLVYSNRYMLCRMASVTTRRLHKPATPFCQAITDAFAHIAPISPVEADEQIESSRSR